ncbi:MAG: General secretion pathway protein E [Rhodanobacteraceae bacterium]|jgi:general secretion pathway protein E|nr:MAG: General secretion pathway protein E [Rhodanobacteraceae bacterium]
MAAKPLLGEMLVSEGTVRTADVERALEMQKQLGGRLGSLLLRVGAISEDSLLDALSRQLELPVLGRELPAPDESALRALAQNGDAAALDWMLDQQVLAWEDAEGIRHCAARDPLAPGLREALRFVLGAHEVRYCLASSQLLERLLDQLAHLRRGAQAELGDSVQQLREMAEEAPIVELVNNVMAQAVEQRASDIHFEPEEHQLVVRFRIDGVLYTRLQLPRERFAAVASRVKLISDMDIAERRLPQDGRLSIRASGQELDVRVSAIPGVHGESIVLRLLPKDRKDLSLANLGMAADHLALMHAWTRETHGIVLVTGPTGSGKSTTLYAALAASNDGQKKIITVEDPVEFELPGVTQIQTHAEIGLTFANALRSILRQDPDVVMIGEIRDLETAQIAIQASLTGHLVLSTLHTNDAISAFTRLVDMGVEPFLVATPLRAVQAQRLVRRLCPHCARPASVVPAEAEALSPLARRVLGDVPAQWREPVGCAKCLNTGYKGRVGIYEMIDVSTAMRAKINAGASVAEMTELARAEGYRSLREDGMLKAWQGVTSVEEVLRVTGT